MKIKVSTPEDMEFIDIETVIEKFEKELQRYDKGLKRYNVIITGEFPRSVLDDIEKIYLDAGWGAVTCRTSSENGERGCLTSLILSK